jgi:hypothetical protein
MLQGCEGEVVTRDETSVGVHEGRGLVFFGSERGVGRVAAWPVINGRWWRPVLMAIKGEGS